MNNTTNQLKLATKAIKGQTTGYHRVVVTPTHVSNGHWAIPRARLSNDSALDSEQTLALIAPKADYRTVEQDTIDRVCSHGNTATTAEYQEPVIFTDTGLLSVCGKVHTRIYCADNGAYAGLDEVYVQWLGLEGETLLGHPSGTRVLSHGDVWIMPKKFPMPECLVQPQPETELTTV